MKSKRDWPTKKFRDSHILSVDDDPLTQRMIEGILTFSGYRVICAPHGPKGLEEIQKEKPGLILLDVLMPEMNGYEFCARLQESKDTSDIPVIFLTVLGSQQDRAKAFSAGAVDYLMKPIDREILLTKIDRHLRSSQSWQDIREPLPGFQGRLNPGDFSEFKEFLIRQLNLLPPAGEELHDLQPSEVYSRLAEFKWSPKQTAESMAQFLKLPYLSRVHSEDILLDVLPPGFCRKYLVVPVRGEQSKYAFVLTNPFVWELINTLEGFLRNGQQVEIRVTEPENILSIFREKTENKTIVIGPDPDKKRKAKSYSKLVPSKEDQKVEIYPVISLTTQLLESAVAEKASDIHIEPKENITVVRLRIDGDMRDFWSLEKDMGTMLISRLKALAEMDIAERRKPQDGSVEATIHDRTFKLRLATTSTPSGESLIIRILNPEQKAESLENLGMSEEQTRQMQRFTSRRHGLILVVGPTGSGKTTTIYSLLSQIDCQTRSLISVEDPVEYRIPFANQQQVSNKAGVTFETFLKSSVRQDPNILFIGEIRDPYSAKIAFDFASTGHLTLTTLHTSNATTAIFRLERLEVPRGAMADAILGIIAQRLLKKLCPFCKKVEPATQEEIGRMAPFTEEILTHTAHPVGCSKCNQTGYRGREGIYEVIYCDAEVTGMIRSGRPISEIREFVRTRGVELISERAVQGVRNLSFPLKDVYEKVLVEENPLESQEPKPKETFADPVHRIRPGRFPSILVVEDDATTRRMVSHFLETEGYRVTAAGDGIDALLKLGESRYDLILSDINIPNLDGFKLLEMVQQKGFGTPLILMTGRIDPEDEARGLELGATDYLKKPIKKEVLLFRIRKVLENNPPAGANPVPPGIGSILEHAQQ